MEKLYIWNMANIRKYPKTEDYFVYAHTTPNGLYYIGMSKQQPRQRWRKSAYKAPNSLTQYIEKYGWQNIEHKVLLDGLTKKEAEQWEDRIIQALSMNGLCINERRSGGQYRKGKQVYMKQWYEDNKEHCKQYREEHKEEKKAEHKQYREYHKEEKKAYQKQRLSTAEGKIYYRVCNYNRNHTPIETPMEAREKYLQWGYIPAYIKHDDLN